MDILTCPCGKQSVEFDVGPSWPISVVMELTGFCFMMSQIGEHVWLCKECSVKIRALALAIFDITKNDQVTLVSIIRNTAGVSSASNA